MAAEDKHRNDFLTACEHGDISFLRKYVKDHRERKDFCVVDRDGWGPLHLAVFSNSLKCVRTLLTTKLVDIHLIGNFGDTCLDVGIGNNVSCDIIRLLLENDPNFYLIGRNFGSHPISLATMETIIDTLQQMRYPFSFEFLNASADHLRFQTEKSKSIKIFKKLILLVVNETSASSSTDMHRVYLALMQFPFEISECLFKWCIERWHLTERNEHRQLVRKLLDDPALGFHQNVIFFLHSELHSLGLNYTNYDSRFYLRNTLDCFLKLNTANRAIIDEVTNVLWPKVNMREFNRTFYLTLLENRANPKIFRKMTSIEWLDTTKIGDKLEIEAVVFYNILDVKTILNALMPFSTEVSADVHLPWIRKELDLLKNGLARNIEEFRAHEGNRDVLQRWERCHSDAVGQLLRLNDDDELVKFCINGNYRAKSNLKSLCRAEIRRSLLRKSNGEKIHHSQLVKNIRSLELPASLQQFLLLNYSDYDF